MANFNTSLNSTYYFSKLMTSCLAFLRMHTKHWVFVCVAWLLSVLLYLLRFVCGFSYLILSFFHVSYMYFVWTFYIWKNTFWNPVYIAYDKWLVISVCLNLNTHSHMQLYSSTKGQKYTTEPKSYTHKCLWKQLFASDDSNVFATTVYRHSLDGLYLTILWLIRRLNLFPSVNVYILHE